MMGKAAYIIAGSRQAHEDLSCHFSDPEPTTVTTATIHPFSS